MGPSLWNYLTFGLLAIGFIVMAGHSLRSESTWPKRIGGALLFTFFLGIAWLSYWKGFYSVAADGTGIQLLYYMPSRQRAVPYGEFESTDLSYREGGRGVHRFRVFVYLKSGDVIKSAEMSQDNARQLGRKITELAKPGIGAP